MISLTNLELTPYPLVCSLFAIFICVLTIPLVVLMFWGLEFLHQQESSPILIFLRLTCLYQHELNTKVVNSLKYFWDQIPYFLSKFETQFYSYSCSHTLTHLLQPL